MDIRKIRVGRKATILKRGLLFLLGVWIALSLVVQSQACLVNSDCALDSACIKDPGATYGVCRGGLTPGDKYDKKPSPGSLGTLKPGSTCSYDTDCGIGESCIKSGYSISGTCIGKSSLIKSGTQDIYATNLKITVYDEKMKPAGYIQSNRIFNNSGESIGSVFNNRIYYNNKEACTIQWNKIYNSKMEVVGYVGAK